MTRCAKLCSGSTWASGRSAAAAAWPSGYWSDHGERWNRWKRWKRKKSEWIGMNKGKIYGEIWREHEQSQSKKWRGKRDEERRTWKNEIAGHSISLHFHRLLTFFSYLVLEAVVWTEATFQAEPQDLILWYSLIFFASWPCWCDWPFGPVLQLASTCFNCLSFMVPPTPPTPQTPQTSRVTTIMNNRITIVIVIIYIYYK